jgi:AcrR family transcriptional regulator
MDRRIEKTRQLIMDTFMELMKEKGFEKLTIRDIAERANINRGTVYLHYIDKYDLLDKCIDNYVNELLVHCQGEGPIRLHTNALLDVFSYLGKHLSLYQLLLKNDSSGLFHSKFYSVMAQQVEVAIGLMPRELAQSKEVTTEFLVNGFLGVMEWWLNHSMPYTPQEITNQLLAFLNPYIRDLAD